MLYQDEFKEICEDTKEILTKEGLNFTTMTSKEGEIVSYTIYVAPKFSNQMYEIFMNNYWETPEDVYFIVRFVSDPTDIYEIPIIKYETLENVIKEIKGLRTIITAAEGGNA